MTVARRFPKLIVKSDAAQLTLSANALAVLSGVSLMPSKPAPKQLPIVVGRSFRVIIMHSTAHYSLSLFRDHLLHHLVANAESLGISTSTPTGDTILTVEMKDAPWPIHPPYATLDYITLDYHLKPNPATNASFSESQELLLPLRTLLDDAVLKFLFIRLPRNLPLAFSQLKEVTPREMDMARRMGGYVDRVLSLSPDSQFQRTLKKRFKKIRKQARASQAAILEQLDLAEEHFDTDELPSLTTNSELLQFAVATICQNTLKPKVQTKVPRAKSPSLGIVELVDDMDESGYLASQESYGSQGADDEDVMEYDDLDAQSDQFMGETLNENSLPPILEWTPSGVASLDLGVHLTDDDFEPLGDTMSSEYTSSLLVNSVASEEHVWSTVDEGFDFSDVPQGNKEASDEEDSILWLD